MSTPCLTDTDSVLLSLSGSPPALEADLNLSADPYQGLEIRPGDGVWAPGRPPVVTALPGAPSDGDEIYFNADPTNSVLWHLRYLAAESSAYKWIAVGTLHLARKRNQQGTISPSGSNTWQDLSGTDVIGPIIGTPLAGYYDVKWGARVQSASSGQLSQVGLRVGSGDPATFYTADAGTAQPVSVMTEMPAEVIGAVAAGTNFQVMYRCDGSGGTAMFDRRWLEILPRKVG